MNTKHPCALKVQLRSTPHDTPGDGAETTKTIVTTSSETPHANAGKPQEVPVHDWSDVISGPQLNRAQSSKRKRAQRNSRVSSAIAATLALLGILIGGFPFVLQFISSQRQHAQSEHISHTVAGWPESERASQLRAAQAYNATLAQGGQPVLGEQIDPFSSPNDSHDEDLNDKRSAKDADYQRQLNISEGIMGSIVIPKISVNLPVIHGSSTEALARGAGHLYGTSLPIGGSSTHAVLTGHRGLVRELMFTRLDEMNIGDTFYIKVMGKTLGYRVDRISVILPNDTSKLRIVPGEDRVTLMTCTPYGVNTHRLLVSGIRAQIPQQIPEPSKARIDLLQPIIFVMAAELIGLLLLWTSRRSSHLSQISHSTRRFRRCSYS